MSVEHDSVVARPTYSRTVQIEHLSLPEGLNATLPSTINAKGAVVSNVVHPDFRDRPANNRDGMLLPGTAGTEPGTAGSFAPGDLGGDLSGPSLQSRARSQQNRITEIDVPANRSRSGNNVGFASPAGGGQGGFSKSLMSAPGDGGRTGKLTCVTCLSVCTEYSYSI